MTVLVTGASGFVGSALCARLARNGWKVRAASRDCSCEPQQPGFEWVKIDGVNGETDWSEALLGVSHVVHLAAIAHVIGRGIDERAMRDVNVTGAVRLAESATKSGVEQFVFLSSIGAICSAAIGAVAEDAAPAPDSAYGQGKLDAEEGIRSALAGTRTAWTILRPPLVYGPGNPGNMARLLRAIRRGIPLPVGAIHNKRSFLFIDNLVDAIELALVNPAARSRTFHVADGETLSTPDLIRMIARADSRRALVFSCPMGLLRVGAWITDRIRALRGDTSDSSSYSLDRLSSSLVVNSAAIRRELGWTQEVLMESGLRATFLGSANRIPER